MIRKALTILSLLSFLGLLLCVAVWVRSLGKMTLLRPNPRIEVIVYSGVICCIEYGPPDLRGMGNLDPILWSRDSHMCIPTGLFAILPAVEVALGTRRLYRRRKRRKMGRCAECDYDLRGLPEPRCPECGTPFDEATRSQRLVLVRRTGNAAVWGKGAALSGFAVLVVGMWCLLDGVASRVLHADWISYVSAKTGLSEIIAISVIIALIVGASFACSRLLYVRIAFRRVPDLRNADSPLVESLAGKNSNPQHEGKPRCA